MVYQLFRMRHNEMIVENRIHQERISRIRWSLLSIGINQTEIEKEERSTHIGRLFSNTNLFIHRTFFFRHLKTILLFEVL